MFDRVGWWTGATSSRTGRRSLAMLTPGTVAALSREEAMALVSELADVQAPLAHLLAELHRLVKEADAS